MESLHSPREDPLSGRLVVVAPGRALRPGLGREAIEAPSAEELDTCPFCEGREARTPPETLALSRELAQPDTPGWGVRVVPNLYPAFARQEVVIHTPRHARSLAELDERELALVARAWQERAAAAQEEGLAYVHALVNEGRAAGATLGHSHSQLVWLREEPPLPAEERRRGAGGCRVCALLATETRSGERVVDDRDGVVSLCPFASRSPFELLVAPLRHEPDAWQGDGLAIGLSLLAGAWRRLHTLHGPQPANAWLHVPPFGEDGHWHLEALPRMTVPAGVELGAGLYVNPLPPEQAARELRELTT